MPTKTRGKGKTSTSIVTSTRKEHPPDVEEIQFGEPLEEKGTLPYKELVGESKNNRDSQESLRTSTDTTEGEEALSESSEKSRVEGLLVQKTLRQAIAEKGLRPARKLRSDKYEKRGRNSRESMRAPNVHKQFLGHRTQPPWENVEYQYRSRGGGKHIPCTHHSTLAPISQLQYVSMHSPGSVTTRRRKDSNPPGNPGEPDDMSDPSDESEEDDDDHQEDEYIPAARQLPIRQRLQCYTQARTANPMTQIIRPPTLKSIE